MPIIACGVAIVRREREFLIAQRRSQDTFGGYWEFPGGKKRDDETFERCAAREVREELGIEIVVGEKFFEIRKEYDNRLIWLHFYLCSHLSGDPRPIDCTDVRWVDVEELKNFKFPPANERVIEKLLRLVNDSAQVSTA
jgi:mutator protein MutT